jgi:hypothetical protein
MEMNNMGMPVSTRSHWIKKIVFLVLILLIALGWFFCNKIWLAMNAEGYQSVFLTNGQVYFGKITSTGKWIKLTEIYYLQATQPLQQEGSDTQTPPANQNQNIQLIKLGSELHGPQDVMYIEKDKILFWENMKDDSKVMQAIRQYQSK